MPLSFWLDSTEEYGVTIAASLAHHFLDQNRTVGMIVNSSQPTVIPTDRGARQMVKILELLTVVHADGTIPIDETLLAEGALFLAKQHRRSDLRPPLTNVGLPR